MSKAGGSQPGLTRRQFLERVGAAGGAAAVYETMVALGLIALPPAWSGPPGLDKGQGIGQSVLVLGAGIGGLTAAYLLHRAGYDVRLFEASDRAGGRNHTARRGSRIVERDGAAGYTVQTCEFDRGLYCNLGPGRIPYHHRRVIGYCRELGVGLEPYIMHTSANLYQAQNAFGGQPRVQRALQHDARGYIAELLAKVVNQGALDADLNAADRQRLLGLLRKFGPLGEGGPFCDSGNSPTSLLYQGTTRAGCAGQTPTVDNFCQIPTRMSLNQLLSSQFWDQGIYDPNEFDWQPTLFQPIGGMDQIVEGFLRVLGDRITYNAAAARIRLQGSAVEVTFQTPSDSFTERADFCISNIPGPLLARLDHNFSSDFASAINTVRFASSCKVGWQANERFWEDEDNQIYGGISWTNHMIEQIWYPSNDYLTRKGVLVGAYIHDGFCAGEPANATLFGNYDLDTRLRIAREGAALLHAQFNDERIVPSDRALSVAWQHVQWAAGAWPLWGGDGQAYGRILRPEGRFHVVGDQASTLSGWQEGAMMSAEHVVSLIGGLKSAEDIPRNVTPPDAELLIRGHG